MHRTRQSQRTALYVAASFLAAVVAAFSPASPAAAREADDGVLILGGAGRSGSAVARRLVARGEKVTVLVRASTDRSRLAGLPVTYVVGDAKDPASARAAFEGKRYGVVYETLQFHHDDGGGWAAVYEIFVPWAKRTGVRQWIALGGGCSDRAAKDCPLSPPLYKVTLDMTRAEHILRDSGVPFTIIRVGALLPTDPGHPQAFWVTGRSELHTDLGRFGGVMRNDLGEQVAGCIRAERCIGKIFVVDDPTLKPQLQHFICRRSYETDTVRGYEPRCGEVPPFTDARPLPAGR